MSNIIKCKKCGQEYDYIECGGGYPGGKDREEALCPYCGEADFSRMTSGYFETYKVDSNGQKIS